MSNTLPIKSLTESTLAATYPKDKTLADLLVEQAARTPDAVAVVFENQQLTYRELDEQSNRLAHYLRRCGVDRETLVPVCLDRSLAMIIALLGVLKAGGAYVPIDPDYPEERIRYILTDVNGPVVVGDDSSRAKLTEAGLESTLVWIDGDWPTICNESIVAPQTGLTPQNAAYVIYTSGSTGRPKGVVIEHENVVRLFITDTPLFDFGARDVWTMFHSFCFDFSVWEMYGALFFGGRLVVVPKSVAQDARLFGKLLADQGVTVLNQTPSAFYVLQEQVVGTREAFAVRYVIFGGEALNPAKLKPWKGAYPNCQLINMYGITETTVHVTYLALDDDLLNGSTRTPDCGSPIGKPISTLTTYVLDADQNEVPAGEIGELYVGGAGLARGYLSQPELTAQRFIPHPFSPEPKARLYRSGDLARQLPSGDLEYLGRIDEQVKIRGYRIELGEIEGVMVQHPGVKQAVVVAKDDAGGGKRLVGYVVQTGVVDRADLIQFLYTRLPDYMVPALLMPVEAIPLTSNGKVDRNALPNPDASDLLTNAYVAPGNALQNSLIATWKEVLQVSRVGLDDNFFELGGNSLLAVKTVSLLRQERGHDVPVTKLYQFPTVGKLANFIEGRTKPNPQPLRRNEPARPSGDVAVIGMAGRFPGANTVDELWQVLREGRETIRFFTDSALDPSLPADLTTDPAYVKARGIVDGADTFDAVFFGLNPKLAEVMDPQQRVFLETAWEVLEKTGYLPHHYEGRVGVWAGCGNNTYYLNNVLQNQTVVSQVGAFQAMTVNEKDFIASRTAYQLNLEGPAVSVYSACSSSLLAITQAVESLRTGRCEVAIAGGASITAPIHSGHLYEEGAMLSRDGHCRPFDAGAGGTVFSDGVGVVLLKSLEAARQDGDTIYALIKGVGVNNDGGGKGSFTAPSAEGQAGAIRMALTDAQVDPTTISYIEAHGTATPLGDPIEIEGLKLAFGELAQKQFCAIGSIKSNMGHLTAAAGVAGFIKSALSLYHRQLPPSLGFETPNPVIAFAGSPFFVNASLTEWASESVRRAGVSSFGVGGTNVHVVLEEYIPTAPPTNLPEPVSPRSAQLITWSAKSEASLDTYGCLLAQVLEKQSNISLADLAFTGQTTRPAFAYRRFLVAETDDELARCVAEKSALPTISPGGTPGELVFLFPGQGSQYLNMGRDLYEHESVYRQAVDTCAELLAGHIDLDIRAVLFPDIGDEGANERLKNTRYTQPALFVTEYALAKLWTSWGMKPTVFCGHSIGEFVAAHLAGIFSLADALTLVSTRGRLISDLPGGSMLSVRLASEKVQFLLPVGVSIAAINGPQQCVVAGPDELVIPFAQSLTNRQIPNRMLETSHAFHSAMMDPVLDEFEKLVERIPRQRPRKPIVSTVSGTWMTEAQATDPRYWATHMRLPVRFSDALNTVFTVANPILLEVGPGSVGVNLARQHAAPRPIQAMTSFDLNSGEGPSNSDTRSMLMALGALWGYGLEPDWSAFYAGQARQRIDLPTYAFDRKPCWVSPISVQPPGHAASTQPVQPEIIVQPVAPTLTPTLMRKDILFQTVGSLLNETAGITLDDVSPAISFLELGLDSLVLTQLSFKLRKTFDLPLSFRQLSLEYNSPERLVAFLDSRLPADAHQPPAPVVVQPPAAPVVASPVASVNTPLPQLDLLMGMQSAINQPVAPVAGSDSDRNTDVMNLMNGQLQIMAQQLAVLRGSAPAGPVAATISQPIPKTLNPTQPGEATGTDAPKPFGAGARIERQITALGDSQKQFLHELVVRYNQKTAQSKAYTQQHRRWMADPRAVTGFKPLTKELVYPLVVDKSKGSRLWDIDNNEYIDVLNGFGSNLFGYGPDWLTRALQDQIEKGYEIGPQHRLAGEVCRLVCTFTNFDRAALCNTGSEAVMATLRLARTVTGRSLVVIFSGSYHGIFDEVVARGASNLKSYPAALGVQPEAVQNVLILDYGTPESLQIIRERAGELAAVLVEPVQSRRPEFVPVEFLKQVRAITAQSGTALIFDEVITGFRMHPGGAQALFGIQADLASYGKVIGGGLPIGVLAGKSAYMNALDGGFWDYGDASYPESDITFFAGTFVRHPLALAAANASLTYMQAEGSALQQRLTDRAAQLAGAMNDLLTRHQSPALVAQFGSLWKLKFTQEIPYGELLFTLMREKGIHIWDGFPCFLTEDHTEAELTTIITAFGESLAELIGAGFIPGVLAPAQKEVHSLMNWNHPPIPGARLGRDPAGNPEWFVADQNRPGKYSQDPEISRVTSTTEPQMEIWMACALGGDDANRAFNESVSLRFQGVPERTALEDAVRQLIRRHESLRSAFSADGRQMIIFRDVPALVQFEDYTTKTAIGQTQAVTDFFQQVTAESFDLLLGPLFKVSLLTLSADDSYLVLTAHHIVCDGWSMGIVMQDLSALYSANVQNQCVNLPEPVLFGDFADAQNSFERSTDYARVQKFWLDLYKSDVPVVDVPTDFPRPKLRTYKSHRLDFSLDETLVAALKNTSREAGCSFATMLITLFDVWLHRLTGQPTISLGLPAAGQSVTGDYRLVGHCVNLLPLRSHLSQGVRFVDFLKQRNTELMDAYDHQQLTFGSLLKKLSIARDPSRIPLVPVVFNLDVGQADGVDFRGLPYQLMSNPRAYENFELFLNASGSGKSLLLEWSYNTQLFKPDTICAMMAGFENLIRTVMANPSVRVDALSWAVPANLLKTSIEEKSANSPKQQSLSHLLAQTAARFPEKTALEYQHQKLTHRRLHESANQLARYLVDKGIQKGDIVGVALERSPEMLITLLSILKAGAAYLPLDPTYPHDRIAYMLTDSSARMVVTSKKYAGRLNVSTMEVEVEKALTESSGLPTSELAVAAGGDDLAYVLYTSGSTGKPKGVLIEHHSVVNLLKSIIDWPGITPDDRLLAVTTISFDIASLELFLPLLVGATLVLADTETARDGRLLIDAIKNEQISFIQATPATYKMMLAAGWETPLPLKVLCCGEPLAKDLAQKLMPCCASLWNMYGPTETTIYSTGKQILPSDQLITIGRPIHNTQVYILDAAGNRLGIGSVGEITIAGEGVGRGYHNRPDLNAEKFIKNPFGEGLLYRTGDLGKWTPDGEIHCLGRMDQQVKIRGYRIELGEIEQVLSGAETVREAVVLVRDDRPGGPYLVAHVVPETTPAEQEIPRWRELWRQRMKDALPDHMVPTEFVILPQMPLTPNGKIDRKALLKPERASQSVAPAGIGLQTREEKLVAAIWSDVLGLNTINDTDDFFELGGHSLIALQVMNRIEKETGKRLPLSTLFEYPTISKLAALLQTDKKATAWKSLVPIKPTGSKMPIYFVHGDGLNVLNFNSVAHKMDSDQPVYGFQALGQDGQDEPLGSVEDMATFYVSELLEQNPTGPYALAGYSFGGYIAVEMARILRTMGKEIRLLGILDTDTEIVTSDLLDANNLYKRIRRQFPKLLWMIRSFIRDPAHTIAYQKKFYKRKSAELLEAVGLREKSKPNDMLHHLAPIKAKLESAYDKHVIRPFDGHVTLFRAHKRSYFVVDFSYLGWSKYALKGVTICEVPGDHNTMFDAPNDQETARIIQTALNESR